jgi:hypothetical protein
MMMMRRNGDGVMGSKVKKALGRKYEDEIKTCNEKLTQSEFLSENPPKLCPQILLAQESVCRKNMVLSVEENAHLLTNTLVPEAIDGRESVTIRGRHITFSRWHH